MVSASIGVELISEPYLIPVWFYSYSAIIYAASAFVSALVVYFSYKFFKMSKSKSSMMLMLSFLFLTFAFSALAFTSLYTYLFRPYFQDNLNLGSLGFVNSLGFNLYYILSTVAYASLLIMYLPNTMKKKLKTGKLKQVMPVLYVPLWNLDLLDFHVASIFLLAYVVVKNVLNFYSNRDTNNFLVMFAFLCMISFHAALLFISFDPTIYLAANTLLAVGFTSLLSMLIRVNRSGGKKV